MAVRFMVAFLIPSGGPCYFTPQGILGDRVISFRLLNTARRRRLRAAIVRAPDPAPGSGRCGPSRPRSG
jgi:hypothetical protein